MVTVCITKGDIFQGIRCHLINSIPFAVHYYNYILDGWDSNIFPKARFISEYGFQSIPSLHSLKQTMYTTDKLDDLVDHRQHFPFGSLPIINLMTFHLPMPRVDSNYWNTFIYFSQISQAMATKTETETYRFVCKFH